MLSIFDIENPNGYSRVKIENSEISHIVEQKDANEYELAITHVNSGIYAFKKEVFYYKFFSKKII